MSPGLVMHLIKKKALRLRDDVGRDIYKAFHLAMPYPCYTTRQLYAVNYCVLRGPHWRSTIKRRLPLLCFLKARDFHAFPRSVVSIHARHPNAVRFQDAIDDPESMSVSYCHDRREDGEK